MECLKRHSTSTVMIDPDHISSSLDGRDDVAIECLQEKGREDLRNGIIGLEAQDTSEDPIPDLKKPLGSANHIMHSRYRGSVETNNGVREKLQYWYDDH